MFENVLQTRAAICGAGLLTGLIFYLAHLPLLLLIVPVAILVLGIIADPEETHAVWYGMLNVLGIFALPELSEGERLTYAQKKHYFWFGEVAMAAILAGIFAVPMGIFLAGRADSSLAFIGSAVLFLPLFIFLPKLIRWLRGTDIDPVLKAFGKNEQTRKVFWSVFLAVAGLMLAQVVDPPVAGRIIAALTGTGG
jgi:hypothetical protein